MEEANKIEMALEYDPHWQSLELITEEDALFYVETHLKNGCIYMLVEVVIPG